MLNGDANVGIGPLAALTRFGQSDCARDYDHRTGEGELMLKTSNPSSIAPPQAMYSHSVEIPANARILYTAGQVGVRPDGSVPDGFEAQHDQVWQNTLAILADAGMGPEDIVRLNVYSTDPDGLKYLKAHREKYLKPGHTPASTWVVVKQLAQPAWVVEMETVAAKVD